LLASRDGRKERVMRYGPRIFYHPISTPLVIP